MIGAVLTTPVNEGSDLGVMFFDSLGFEGMCGHGTIGIVTTLIETGQITPVHPFTEGKAGHGYRYCRGACKGRP